jgi:hypothetical protein
MIAVVRQPQFQRRFQALAAKLLAGSLSVSFSREATYCFSSFSFPPLGVI